MYTIYIGRTLISNIFKAMLKIISLIFTMTKMIKSVILIPMRIWKAKSNWLHTETYYVDKKYYVDKQKRVVLYS